MKKAGVIGQINKKQEIKQQNIIISIFFQWYYLDGVRFILKIWKNFLVFILNYFSVSLLLKTFFSSWKRYYESYGRGFSFKRYITAFFSNILFRLIGMFTRTLLMVVWIIVELFIVLIGIIAILIWILLPLLLVAGVFIGFRIILGI